MWKRETGMITVEAAVMLTMFIMFFVAVMRIMDAVAVQARIQRAVSLAAKEVSAYGYLENTVYDPVEFGMPDAAGDLSCYASPVCRDVLKEDPDIDNYLKKHGVKGGLYGVHFTGGLSMSDKRMRITASYRIRYLELPFLPDSMFSKNVVVNATTGLWED